MENLTPFTLYLLMQADTIRESLVGAAILSGLATAASALFWSAVCDIPHESRAAPMRQAARWLTLTAAAILTLTWGGATFFPGTKTLAVAFGVPAAVQELKAVQAGETVRKSFDALNRALDQAFPAEPK